VIRFFADDVDLQVYPDVPDTRYTRHDREKARPAWAGTIEEIEAAGTKKR
jgi:hypothetical protein